MNEDIQKVLIDNDVDKISFYYINSPIVNNAFTTCVLINSSQGTIEARGVSICSVADTFNKSEGKNKALGRAVRALARRESNWKIHGIGRDDEYIRRSMKIKTQTDESRFANEVVPELKRIDPDMTVVITNCGSYKKYTYEIPISYPVKLANSLYRYKSQYRPTPVGAQETELLKKRSIFTEPILDEA